ncbi:MAG: YidC/Oxa1 family membrane protein insertase [Candidatus Harrisonbacteria bacterium]|nr:YidC/Oxa1 family membrane protein insertase [Candidatus Harrisonbacteria bacterium]
MSIFHTILYQPLFNALVFLYENIAFEDLGIAIILLTLIIRFILYPLFYKSFKNQTLMQKIQPEIKKIQHDHKDNKEKQAQAMIELYRRHKVNPFSSFLLILVQLPVLIVLYRLFLNGFSPEAFADLYAFVPQPAEINNFFLGLIDLQKRSILVVVLAVVLQYFQGRLSLPKKTSDDPAAKVSRSMVVIGPVLTLVILTSLPAAIGVYWLASSAFSIVQQIIVNKKLRKEDDTRISDKS